MIFSNETKVKDIALRIQKLRKYWRRLGWIIAVAAASRFTRRASLRMSRRPKY